MKTKNIKYMLLSMFCIAILNVSAQTKALKIGDRLPDVYLASIVKYKKKSANLRAEFNDRPLIIDFWQTHCGPCIMLMPVMDSIQKEFNNQFNVLMVSDEPASVIDPFLTKKENLKNLTAPSVASDKILHELFPPNGIPSEVWVDKNGVVQAITGADQVTRENIANFVRGEKLTAKNKEKFDIRLDVGMLPFAVLDEQFNNGMGRIQYSYLGHYINGMSGLSGIESNYQKLGLFRLKQVRKDIKSLYMTAFDLHWDSIKPYQFIIMCKDSKKFNSDPKTNQGQYIYEAIMKDSSATGRKVRKRMQHDLDEEFGIKSKIVKNLLPCYVIRRLSNTAQLGTKGGQEDNFIKEKEEHFVNYPFGRAFLRFNQSTSLYAGPKNYLVLDETGYYVPSKKIYVHVDLVMPTDWSDISKVNEKLKIYGLKIDLEERLLNCIVLEDAD